MWIWIGILSLLIGIASLTNIVTQYIDDRNKARTTAAVENLDAQCDFVCNAGPGTNLSTQITLSPPTTIYTDNRTICGVYEDTSFCQRCDCQIRSSNTLNLTGSFAEQFNAVSYTCNFINENPGVTMTCAG